jgi:hypothetical protein
MLVKLTRCSARMALIAGLAASAAFTSAFGPPHITVRTVTPSDNAPAGAVLLVAGSHHDKAAELTITGRAEGIVNGRRVSQQLRLSAHRSPGQVTVTKQWQDGSPWILVLSVTEGTDGAHGVAEALVAVDAGGSIGRIEYPAPGWIGRTNTPKRIAAGTIDTMLAQMVARR